MGAIDTQGECESPTFMAQEKGTVRFSTCRNKPVTHAVQYSAEVAQKSYRLQWDIEEFHALRTHLNSL